MTETTITREDDKALIRPAGDIVTAALPELRSAMKEMVNEGVRDMVVDLASVHMVDSSGLGLLISAHNSLQKVGGKLSVVRASPELLELFHMMRIHQHFSVTGD